MTREYAKDDAVMIKKCSDCGQRHDVLKPCPSGEEDD
jgi:hypothetical protein